MSSHRTYLVTVKHNTPENIALGEPEVYVNCEIFGGWTFNINRELIIPEGAKSFRFKYAPVNSYRFVQFTHVNSGVHLYRERYPIGNFVDYNEFDVSEYNGELVSVSFSWGDYRAIKFGDAHFVF